MGQVENSNRGTTIIYFFTRLIRKLSIHKRLLVSFLIITIIPNIIIGYYSFTYSSNEMVEKITNSSNQVLKGVENNIKSKLELYEALSNQIGKNGQIIDLIEECKDLKQMHDVVSIERYEASKVKIGNLLYQFSLSIDTSNIEILTEEDEFRQFDNSGRESAACLVDSSDYRKKEKYLQSTRTVGWPIWTDTSRESDAFQITRQGTTHLGYYITLLRSIKDKSSNKSIGVVIITVPIRIFTEMVDLENMYDRNESVLLLGKEGIIMMLNGKYNMRIQEKSVLNEIYQKKKGTIIITIDDKKHILAFRKAGIADMVVAYVVERRKALSSVYKVRDIIISVTAGCVICAMLLAYLVTLSISKPLSNLKKTMEKVGSDGLVFEYEDKGKDEIGILGHRFNEMIREIKNLMESIIETETTRKSEETKRKEAELDALQMQIQDHFLYNSLDLIRWNAMFLENGNGTLSKMLEDFSKFFRLSTKDTKKLVDINEEIEHLEAYIKVIRFKKDIQLQLKINIVEQDILKNKITKLTFQPIVENALKYGYENTQIEAVISISAYRAENDLFIEIRDNGRGMTKDLQNKINDYLQMDDDKRGAIGFRNVNKRIKLNFGSDYGLKIESEEGKYTLATIHIPNVM